MGYSQPSRPLAHPDLQGPLYKPGSASCPLLSGPTWGTSGARRTGAGIAGGLLMTPSSHPQLTCITVFRSWRFPGSLRHPTVSTYLFIYSRASKSSLSKQEAMAACGCPPRARSLNREVGWQKERHCRELSDSREDDKLLPEGSSQASWRRWHLPGPCGKMIFRGRGGHLSK